MKTAIAIVISLSLFTTSVAVFAINGKVNPVQVVPVKHKNLFVFTVNKSWHGAYVEVIAVTGECVSCQTLTKRKMIINFCNVKPGTYTVRISKDGHSEEFNYTKN